MKLTKLLLKYKINQKSLVCCMCIIAKLMSVHVEWSATRYIIIAVLVYQPKFTQHIQITIFRNPQSMTGQLNKHCRWCNCVVEFSPQEVMKNLRFVDQGIAIGLPVF